MAKDATQGTTGSTTTAQNRFVVSLPKDVGTSIDSLAARMAESMRKQYGVGVELNRAQVVTSLVQSALKTFEDVDSAASEDGGEA